MVIMVDQEPKVLLPDSVAVANKKLKVELPAQAAKKVIAFTAPVDEQVTKDLEWENPDAAIK